MCSCESRSPTDASGVAVGRAPAFAGARRAANPSPAHPITPVTHSASPGCAPLRDGATGGEFLIGVRGELDIRRLSFLFSWDQGGVTDKDVALAREIEAVAAPPEA